MNNETKKSKFLAAAKSLVPKHYADINAALSDCADDIDESGIDEAVFRSSEYLGGMAAVILATIE